MPVQSNKLNFKGQNIYIGIDVHLKKLECLCLCRRIENQAFLANSISSRAEKPS